MMCQNIFRKNNIIYLFDNKRQNDCIVNIKETHTDNSIFNFIYNMMFKERKKKFLNDKK